MNKSGGLLFLGMEMGMIAGKRLNCFASPVVRPPRYVYFWHQFLVTVEVECLPCPHALIEWSGGLAGEREKNDRPIQ